MCSTWNVRNAAALVAVSPYTGVASMNELMELVRCRGTPRDPVVGSNTDRENGMTLLPVPCGSNDASPLGTAMLNFSNALELVSVRSKS